MSVLKSPQAGSEVEVLVLEQPPRNRWRLRLPTVACFGLALLTLLLAVSLDGAGAPRVGALVLTGSGVVFAFAVLVAAARTLIGLYSLVRVVRGVGDMTLAQVSLTTAGNAFMVWFGYVVGMLATFGFSRGRQLRRHGRVLLPALRANAEWTGLDVAPGGVASAPDGLADQWRENGKTEHASVAAFARLTLDLMALGAPPRLVTGANQDSLDEIRHAEMCFSLATALDGKRVSPAPFPEAQRVSTLPRLRSLALAQLAVSSLVDGALHEGVSARIIARLARRCESEAVRAMLKSIAADEGRHSAHGWDVVEWCLEQGGSGVGEALLGALGALPREMKTALPAEAADGGWERFGIHGHALEAEVYGESLTYVAERVRGMVNGRQRVAA